MVIPLTIEFSNEEIDYFKSRIVDSSNNWLISKYAHLIWQQTRHNHFAEIALMNYLTIIRQFEKEEMHQLPVMLSAIIHISQKTKKQTTEVKDLILELLQGKSLGLKYRNLKLAIDNELFEREELKQLAHKLPNWVSENLTSLFCK